ncbi:MAG: hypothetical protein P4L51_07160 [Puia sp.]|nr:hypothetical protein [Puia sp.]
MNASNSIRQTKPLFAVKLETSFKSALPVKFKPRRNPTLKSIVLLEKINSFRREKDDLPGAHARFGL